MLYVNGCVNEFPGENLQFFGRVNVEVSAHASGHGYAAYSQGFLRDFLGDCEGQNRVDVFFGRVVVFFEPLFCFLNGPAFVFFEQVTLDFHGVFAFWFAYYGFDSFLFV